MNAVFKDNKAVKEALSSEKAQEYKNIKKYERWIKQFMMLSKQAQENKWRN